MRPLLLLLVGLSATGCFLPMSTATPQPATTLGKGAFGTTGYVEFPSVNLDANQGETFVTGSSLELAAFSPSITGVAQVSYGLTDRLDLELGVEGMLYLFFFPLPSGMHLGARYQLVDLPYIKGAVATRLGYSSLLAGNGGDGRYLNAWSGMLSGALQLTAFPVFQPTLAVAYFPANVRAGGPGFGGDIWTHTGTASLNVNLDLGVVELTPFVGAALFTSPRFERPQVLPQVGFALALRWGKTVQTPGEQMRERFPPAVEEPEVPPEQQEWNPAPASPPGAEQPPVLL